MGTKSEEGLNPHVDHTTANIIRENPMKSTWCQIEASCLLAVHLLVFVFNQMSSWFYLFGF